MKTLADLIKEKKGHEARMDALIEILEGNSTTGVQARALTDVESGEISTIKTRLKEMDGEIERAEFIEEQKRRKAGRTPPRGIDPGKEGPSEFERAMEDFSISRAATMVLNKRMDGVEREVNDEAVKLARDCGITGNGGIMVPFLPGKNQSRASNGIGSASGNMISTTLLGAVDGYQVDLFLEQLGADIMRNLVGVTEIPVTDLIASAAYASETATLPEIDPAVRKASLTPKPVVAKIQLTNLLRASAGASSIDSIVFKTLAAAEANAVEAAVINGSGDAPQGIFGNTDVPNLDLSSPGNISFHNLLSLKNNPGKNNARFVNGPRGWITNEDVRTYLESTQHGSSGRFVWDTDKTDMLLGYKAVTTSLMPNDGGDDNDESGMIFGIWSNLKVANWAFRELVIDPYSTDSKTWFKWYSYWCHALTSPKAFVKCRNIITVPAT